MLLIGDITFPRWNGDAQFDPYITEKQIDDALNHGKSLDAAERTAGANEFLIGISRARRERCTTFGERGLASTFR